MIIYYGNGKSDDSYLQACFARLWRHSEFV